MDSNYPWEKGLIGVPPPIPKTVSDYQPIIDEGDFEGLEGVCMERFDVSAPDIAFFIPAYRSFVKKKETGRAEVLLQLHADCLRERGDVASEVRLYSTVLGFWPNCPPARDGLLFHLKKMYFDSPGFDRFVTHLNVLGSPGLETLRLLEAWLRYDEGRCVYMPTKGAGRVTEVNLSLGVVRVSFESGQQLSFKIDEAQRLCQSLPGSHFLARKLCAPGELRTVAHTAPGELLAFLFASVKKPLSITELRDMLSGIVPEASWAAWWTAARKDRRLTVGAGAKAEVTWNETAADAASAIAAQFERAAPLEKPEMMRKHAARSAELAATMRDGIVRDANAALDLDPSLALELALELESLPRAGTSAVSFAPAELAGRSDSVAMIAGVKDRLLRKKAMGLVAEVRADWSAVFVSLLKAESDSQAIAYLYETLCAKGRTKVLEETVAATLAEPSAAPHFYVWLCREMPARPELKARANAEFLFSLLRILDNKAFKGYHASLRKLFDLGEAADWAATTLSSDEAARTLDALNHETGLEDYRKDRVRQEIYQAHPELQEKKETLVYVTSDALEEKKKEFETLVRVDIPQNSLEIKRTREFGDLRENFEYHAARARQEMLSSRAKSLHDELAATRAIDPQTVDTSKVTIGTRVCLRDASGGTAVVAVLGPWDSDPAKNVLSYTSAAGNGMLGSRPGDTVQFNDKEYTIEKIEKWNA